MPTTSPWHSSEDPVYHNNTNCDAGISIVDDDLMEGTGGKPLCPECADLNVVGG